MNKRNISILLVASVFMMLVGCNNAKPINKIANDSSEKEIKKSKDNVIKRKEEINKFLFTQNNYSLDKSVTYRENLFIVNDFEGQTIYLYKNYELLYSFKDSLMSVLISPSEDELIVTKHNYDKKICTLVKQPIYGEKKSSVVYKSDVSLALIKWTKEGIYLKKCPWEEMTGIDDYNIYLLKPNGEIEMVLELKANDCKMVLDIIDDSALIRDYKNQKLYKFNLKTKESIEIKGLDIGVNIYEIYFYGSTDVLIGEAVENNGYEVFLFNLKDGNKKIIQKCHFIGPIKNGFIYKKYIPNAKNGEGDIYVKTLKGEF